MDFGVFGAITFDAAFASALASIVLIDLILAGDNAVVIAMAVRSLPREQRRKGILLGAAAAVLLRVVATFFVAQLLRAPYISSSAWSSADRRQAQRRGLPGRPATAATTVWRCGVIVAADVTCRRQHSRGRRRSRDSLFLAVRAPLSIPFVVFTSITSFSWMATAFRRCRSAKSGRSHFHRPSSAGYARDRRSGCRGDLGRRRSRRQALAALGGDPGRPTRAARRGQRLSPATKRRRIKPMAILTISRDYGSGGREVGRAVAERLGYRYVDRVTLQAALSAADPRWERFGEVRRQTRRSRSASTGPSTGTRRCCSASSSRPRRPTASSSSTRRRSCSPGFRPRCTCASSPAGRADRADHLSTPTATVPADDQRIDREQAGSSRHLPGLGRPQAYDLRHQPLEPAALSMTSSDTSPSATSRQRGDAAHVPRLDAAAAALLTDQHLQPRR
jgi:hypothetical protein